MSALPAPAALSMLGAAPTAATMRRGACPALSAPMQTGDGLLVRLNLAEGGLSPATLSALCAAAAGHGNGLVEITARGSFQIRGLTPASAPLLAAEVNALAIPVRDGVPVETSPLAGLDPRETADPLPLVRTIRAAIEAAGLSRQLGPKVSVVVDGGGQIALDAVAADVRVEAVSGGGWRLSVGGREIAETADESNTVSAVIDALEAIATLGMTARGRDLAAAGRGGSSLPLEGVRRTGETSGSPQLVDAKRPGGVRAAGLNASFASSSAARTPPASLREAPSPQGGGNGAALGILPLHHPLAALAVALPFGQCEAAALAALATAAPSIADFRFAPGRRLLALGPSDACTTLRDRAAALGFVTDPADPRLSVAACPGAPACASGLIPAREIGRQVAAMLPADFSGTVHVSGCAKGCAHPGTADHALVGRGDGVGLVHAGRAADEAATICADAATALDALRRAVYGTAA